MYLDSRYIFNNLCLILFLMSYKEVFREYRGISVRDPYEKALQNEAFFTLGSSLVLFYYSSQFCRGVSKWLRLVITNFVEKPVQPYCEIVSNFDERQDAASEEKWCCAAEGNWKRKIIKIISKTGVRKYFSTFSIGLD